MIHCSWFLSLLINVVCGVNGYVGLVHQHSFHPTGYTQLAN